MSDATPQGLVPAILTGRRADRLPVQLLECQHDAPTVTADGTVYVQSRRGPIIKLGRRRDVRRGGTYFVLEARAIGKLSWLTDLELATLLVRCGIPQTEALRLTRLRRQPASALVA